MCIRTTIVSVQLVVIVTFLYFFFGAVLFSDEKRLASKETPSEIARRVFKSYDPEGNNFIPTPVLQDVLCALDLVSEPE